MTADEVLDAYLASWQRGDTDTAWGFYDEDVVMRLPGRGGLAGEHHGRDAVIAAIRGLLERAETGDVAIEQLDRLSSGDRVAVVLREVVHRGHERLDLRRVNVYRVAGDRIVEIDIFEANQYEVDEFFG